MAETTAGNAVDGEASGARREEKRAQQCKICKMFLITRAKDFMDSFICSKCDEIKELQDKLIGMHMELRRMTLLNAVLNGTSTAGTSAQSPESPAPSAPGPDPVWDRALELKVCPQDSSLSSLGAAVPGAKDKHTDELRLRSTGSIIKMEESEEMKIKEVFSLKDEETEEHTDLMVIKKESEVLNEEKDQYNNDHFITGEKPFSCSQPEHSLSQQTAKYKGKGSYFTCQQCGNKFTQKRNLDTHMKLTCGLKPFTCQQCGKSFAEKAILKRHMLIHTGEKPFTCQHCGKSFNLKGNLKSHMRIHTGGKPFTCQQCGKRFDKHENFQVHMKIHTAENYTYTCSQCGKGFHKQLNLNRHMRIHSSDQPYTCPQCGKTCTQKYHFENHMRIHTGEKPFTCQQCGRSFNRKETLNRHMRVHTGET